MARDTVRPSSLYLVTKLLTGPYPFGIFLRGEQHSGGQWRCACHGFGLTTGCYVCPGTIAAGTSCLQAHGGARRIGYHSYWHWSNMLCRISRTT